jgi:chromosome segregation ATPase
MVVENIMYFVLGLLSAGLLALMIMPAVWRRAVRLTKKRIEAATPMTMAEFRADKDQLRAEFALATRRLEMNVEALRRRLSDQVRDINRKKSEMGGMKSERDSHLSIVRELEEREGELRRRVLELEKESADLSQKLRMRDREYSDKVNQLEAAREAIRSNAPRQAVQLDGKPLSGEYNKDMDEVLGKLDTERKRAGFLETQNRTLLSQLENSDKRTAGATAAAAELRASLAKREDAEDKAKSELIEAEARIADAESRVSQLLEETTKVVETGEEKRDQLLAEKLTLQEEMDKLKTKVLTVESTVMADWDSDRIEQSHMREKLNDIASDVSRLVYALEGNGPVDSEESLFDRVQRFADDGMKLEEFPVQSALRAKQTATAGNDPAGSVSDRMAALRDIQGRT